MIALSICLFVCLFVCLFDKNDFGRTRLVYALYLPRMSHKVVHTSRARVTFKDLKKKKNQLCQLSWK